MRAAPRADIAYLDRETALLLGNIPQIHYYGGMQIAEGHPFTGRLPPILDAACLVGLGHPQFTQQLANLEPPPVMGEVA